MAKPTAMTLNLQAKDSWIIFDEYNMALVKGDELSWRDSIGRTVLAWIAYGEPGELDKGLDDCLDASNNPYVLYRHPDHKEKSSRDHWSYYLIYIKLYGGGAWYNNYIKFIPRMRGMNLWMHSLTGNKWAERAYYLIYIPGALIGNIWLKLCRCAGRIGPERDNSDWIKKYWQGCDTPPGELVLKSRTKWQKLWAWIIFQTMPAYALHNKAWQIYVMPESQSKAKLKRILLQRVGKSNIMLRLLLGDTTVTKEEVDAYPNMTNFRPGVYLDETCRRTIRELTAVEAEWNTYERDLIVWLFEQHKKEIFKRIRECTSKISNLTKGMLMFTDAIVDTNKVFLKFKEAVSLLKRT